MNFEEQIAELNVRLTAVEAKTKSIWSNFYLNIKLEDENAKMPCRAKDGDAGFDVFALENRLIHAHSDALICTGWRCEFPTGNVMIMTNKSGRATKNKLVVGACAIDSGYRGLVYVHLFNMSSDMVHIKKGEKLAQFIIFPSWYSDPVQVDTINCDTSRGAGGFGSTTLY